MPKRDDIKKILLIGSGPIVIGQACEFDYSGVQACKALKEEGFEVVLVNSNPATIMTDPEFADRTYIEPLTCEVLHEIIRRERPDALLPTLGGQTALNLAMELSEKGILKRYKVEMIGATAEAINKAEDRDLFKKAMLNIGLDVPISRSAHTLEQALEIHKNDLKGEFPVVIRPGFTLGGSGGGIAYDMDELVTIVSRGLDYSPTNEVLVEESIVGWKEYEMEVIRDKNDNCIIVCSIENVDAMGVHTGDSVTVAPAQTLTDREYQIMRDASLAVLREIGVETGGSNVQFSLNPKNGRMIVIEMNPRVSRSSALASKATGFPIAKIAAKLAIGYTLDELRNDITQKSSACFEPTIDYVVTKMPRFTFEKFAAADSTLTTQMKSVGEAMSIGKTFKQSFQKACRSMETGRYGFGADGKDEKYTEASDELVAAELKRPNAERFYYIRAAFKRGWSQEKVTELTGMDPWFIKEFAELAAYEEEIKTAGNLEGLKNDLPLFRQVKEMGYSDRQIAHLLGATEAEVRAARIEVELLPVYGSVDTCAAEFSAETPYYYSTYGDNCELRPESDKKKVMILGGGPNRIGQGIEFDYCCVHASFALQDAGFETIMVNSNPETVSTDYDSSDKLFFEPLTLEDVLNIYHSEKVWGVIVQFGGQTPLKLAEELEANGVNIIGTSPASIEAAEDRKFFQELADKIGVLQPPNDTVSTVDEAAAVAARVGYPVLLRPSFVLGGRGMVIAYNEEFLRKYMNEAVDVSEDRPVLIDRFLDDAIEVDVDCVSDGETAVIGAIMEHVEQAGVHSGDSACCIPTISLSEKVLDTIREYTYAFAKELKVCGLMNVQYAIQGDTVYVLEVNPRASRTVPFVSKTIGAPLAKVASLVMAGRKLADIGLEDEITPRYFAMKEAVFPFVRFPGNDVLLSPEMKSTGEVMGIDPDKGMAFLKSQFAAGNKLPSEGTVFLSVRDQDKPQAVECAKRLMALGYEIISTAGTSTYLWENGIKSAAVFPIKGGRPNAIDLIKGGDVAWVVNIPAGGAPRVDEVKMRSAAVIHGVPITTTMSGLLGAIEGLETIKDVKTLEVCSIQEYHRHSGVKLNLS